jgi:phage N-6-adenine-methyltransferase
MSTEIAVSSTLDVAELDALEESALEAIESVKEPDEAERLLAKVRAVQEAQRLARLGADYEKRWGVVRLKAERKYGELLPPPQPGKRTDLQPRGAAKRLTTAELWAAHKARQVAAVPDEVFDEYLNEAQEPSRAELLRASKLGNLAPLMSSKTDQWATPQDLFDQLDAEFGFDLDVCASDDNAKCSRYFTEADDGLAQTWSGVCWMNPPYGEAIGKWVEKARESAEAGATVVCLVPARVDTAWWWDNCRYGEVRFLRGRLKFGDSDTSAPFPSAVVIFGRPESVIWWER